MEVKGLLPSSMPASAIRNQYEVIQQDSSSNCPGFVCVLTVFSDVNRWTVVPVLDVVHQAPHPAGHDVQPYRIGLCNGVTV
jgi:hypothetical protein